MVSYVQSLLANFFQLTTPLQHGRHKKKKISFFLFPAPLGQICFVLVLISPNHKARNRYPEMVMPRTNWLHSERNEEIGMRPDSIKYSETTNMIIEYDPNGN